MTGASQDISRSRRNFLRTIGAGAAASIFGPHALRGLATPKNRKAVVVTFGGGARDDETFSPDGQENISTACSPSFFPKPLS